MSIDLAMFNSVELRFAVTNTNTRGELTKRISLVEILEDEKSVGQVSGMKLDVPSKFCEKGHYLVIHIDIKDEKGKRTKFSTGAKVVALKSDTPGVDQVTASLIQYDKNAWAKFCTRFSDRQSMIDDFFKSIKGT